MNLWLKNEYEFHNHPSQEVQKSGEDDMEEDESCEEELSGNLELQVGFIVLVF